MKSRKNKGLVYVFSGDGKGKTSAALGVAVRSLMSSKKVGWVAWYKDKSWDVSEFGVPNIFGKDMMQMYVMGDGFYLKKNKGGVVDIAGGGKIIDKASFGEHKKAAENALRRAGELLRSVDVLVLDEINNAIFDGLIGVGPVLKLLDKRNNVHLILTGRNVDKRIVETADLVTNMEKIKHPYDKGIRAIKGLDF